MQELIKILHLPQAFNDQSNYHGKMKIPKKKKKKKKKNLKIC